MSEIEFWKDLGNIFDAILNYQKKNVEFNSQFINPWIRLGNIFDRQDHRKEAVQAYQQATEIDAESAQNWINLGDAHFKAESYDEASAAYQKAAELDPQAGWPLSNLGLTLVAQGRYEEAIPLYTAGIELLTDDKDKAISWNRLGNVYRKLNDYENAFESFQKADELDIENTGFRDQLDETIQTESMVAPEEILSQMIVEQPLETEEATATSEQEFSEELPAEEVQPESESQTMDDLESIIQSELPGEPIASDMDMEAEEDDTAAPSEDVMVEQGLEVVLDQTDTIIEEDQAVTETISSTIDEVAVEEEKEEPVAETASESEITSSEPEIKADAQTIEPEGPRVPDWLIIGPNVPLNGTTSAVVVDEAITSGENTPIEPSHAVEAVEATKELSTTESVEITSEIQQESTVSESTISMDVVETYTDFVSAQAMDEVDDSDENADEIADQTDVESEADADIEETVAAVDNDPLEESDIADNSSTREEEGRLEELAYEEYLKDVVEPVNILPDHVNEIHGEAPLTKVSENGEVRIAMDSKNAHVWNELGNVYLNSGSCDDAIASYGKAIELDRLFAWPYSNLALAYVQKGRFAEAILLYQRGIELFGSDKDKAVTWNRLGNVYRRIDDYSNAIAAYQTADELDPENATLSLRSSFGLLGNLYTEQKPNYVS